MGERGGEWSVRVRWVRGTERGEGRTEEFGSAHTHTERRERERAREREREREEESI